MAPIPHGIGAIHILKGKILVNMNVQHNGPSPALVALGKKLRVVYGHPARTFEFVTGYKSPGNVSGHNADSTGTTRAMDVFIGPGNLTEAQGIDLAERLRAEGKRGKVPGHPDRLAYIIHRGRIAGDHTNWEWIAYTGKDGHYDHIHISTVFDYFWGDPIPGNPADYDSAADWELWENEFNTVPQAGSITPIETDFLMTLSEQDQNEVRDNLRKLVAMASAEIGMDKGMNEKLDEVVGNLRKVYWNTAEAKQLLQSAAPKELAAQIDAAGVAVEVRDELVKLLAGK